MHCAILRRYADRLTKASYTSNQGIHSIRFRVPTIRSGKDNIFDRISCFSDCLHSEMKRKQNSFKAVLFQFHFVARVVLLSRDRPLHDRNNICFFVLDYSRQPYRFLATQSPGRNVQISVTTGVPRGVARVQPLLNLPIILLYVCTKIMFKLCSYAHKILTFGQEKFHILLQLLGTPRGFLSPRYPRSAPV